MPAGALYLTDRYENGIDLLIYVFSFKQLEAYIADNILI